MMVVNKFRLYFLLHPAALALYAWIVILVFIPDYFPEYVIELKETSYRPERQKVYFHDLDQDGNSEKIVTGYNSTGKNTRLLYFNKNDKVYDQWFLRGRWPGNYNIILGDYNHNDFAEVYCITRIEDSIFLNIKELLNPGGIFRENKFVCHINKNRHGHYDLNYQDGFLMDLNGDNKKELVFTLHAGYSLFPRNTFAYYIDEDSLVMSPRSASGFSPYTIVPDLNGDGINEITGRVGSPSNIHYKMPYTDSANWLMVIDPIKMDFLFPPKRFDLGIGTSIYPKVFNIKGKKYIALVLKINAANQKHNNYELLLLDSLGNYVNSNILTYAETGVLVFINSKPENDNFYLITQYGEIYKTDTSLQLEKHYINKSSDHNVFNFYYKLLFDINGDSENEFILFSRNNAGNQVLNIYNEKLNDVTTLELPVSENIKQLHASMKYNEKKELPAFCLQVNTLLFTLEYSKFRYHFLKYPFYAGTYFVLLLFFMLLQKVQNTLAKRRYETEKTLMHQQLAISKNQMEPHFMLNVLNYIGFLFMKEDKGKAQYYFGKFASLIHRGLQYADQTETTLEEELKFISDYLTLQNARLGNELNYKIETAEEINPGLIKVPHSLIFTFVENAIKHGLKLKEGEKNLAVYVQREKNRILIKVIDNGIGRIKSKELKTTDTGKGMKIIKNIIAGYNKLYEREISYEVMDLESDEGEALGTEVWVWV